MYKFSFARKETVTSHHRVLLPAAGVNTALNFQPVGGGKAAINGDFEYYRREGMLDRAPA
ncbi:DUF1259 domain-containing protein [Lentzea albidocapillata]|uniref:DUF1259 domain-containing protein n=1 Tax=Lentzea albidocapillata TaxID=40571 RepID=UPI003B848C3E